MHRSNDPAFGIEHAHDLIAGIPDARLLELPGTDHFLFSGDTTPILAAVEDFVVGASTDPASPDRFLATVLFADVVGSAAMAADVGDARFTRLLDDFAATARRCVESTAAGCSTFPAMDCWLLSTARDGACAPPATCGTPCPRWVRRSGWGVHTAEVERRGNSIAGIGVHVASRMAGLAEPGSIWVSRTVTDLVAGCGLAFAPRGEHNLDGLPQPWALFEVAF